MIDDIDLAAAGESILLCGWVNDGRRMGMCAWGRVFDCFEGRGESRLAFHGLGGWFGWLLARIGIRLRR